MKFSVIIPVYNTEKYLAEAIESVLNQREAEFEIIVIDDGSTDGSEKVYSEYIEKYPNQIISIKQENRGQLAARCKGIKSSKGDYCLFSSIFLLISACLYAIYFLRLWAIATSPHSTETFSADFSLKRLNP